MFCDEKKNRRPRGAAENSNNNITMMTGTSTGERKRVRLLLRPSGSRLLSDELWVADCNADSELCRDGHGRINRRYHNLLSFIRNTIIIMNAEDGITFITLRRSVHFGNLKFPMINDVNREIQARIRAQRTFNRIHDSVCCCCFRLY